MRTTTRRDFFRRAAELSGSAAVLAGILQASIEQAFAIEPVPDSSYLDAEHIVVLMQENRSFDHAFGSLRGVRGFNDPRAVTLPDGKPVWQQTNASGKTYGPFRLDIHNTKATWLGSLPHSWRDQTDARNQGNHDKWLDSKPSGRKECAGMPLTMGYYDRSDLPFYYALADAFTICDQHFCSSLTGTTPNRLYLWTGTVRETPEVASMPCVRNSEVDYGVLARWKTFPERLEEAGISWKIYQNELSVPTGLDKDQERWLANFTDNPLEFFEQYHSGLHRNNEALQALPKRERNLYEKAFVTNVDDPNYRELEMLRYNDRGTERVMKVPKGDVLHQFRKDVAGGKLPAVSWLVAPENFSDHPGAPWYGAWYVAEVMDILTRNPEIWKKTIFVLTYDENDGYFDHVPPFVPPDPSNPDSGKASPSLQLELDYLALAQDRKRKPPKDARGGPIGLGYRVPMVVASPWSRGGYVCSQVFDHTSVLQMMENILSHRTGNAVREPNISPWRRAVCGDLSSAFRAANDAPESAAAGKALTFPPRQDFLSDVHKAQFRPLPTGFGNPATPPVQEAGIRPSTALPYEMHAAGKIGSSGKDFELVLRAAGSAGVPFHVYTPGLFRNRADLRTRAYAVKAGEQLVDAWALDGFAGERYHLMVHGPNGFFREFAGSKSDPLVDIACEYTPAGDVSLKLRNRSTDSCHVHLTHHGYAFENQVLALKPGTSEIAIALPLERSFGWYDFSVRAAGAEAFLRRFAGRAENGKSRFSDPVMGRVKV
jgi:phospholipase C